MVTRMSVRQFMVSVSPPVVTQTISANDCVTAPTTSFTLSLLISPDGVIIPISANLKKLPEKYDLYEILHYLLPSFFPEPDKSGPGKPKNVFLVDASVVRQNGKKQEQQRIHMCYSLDHDRMYEVKVTDKHTAESLTHFRVDNKDTEKRNLLQFKM